MSLCILSSESSHCHNQISGQGLLTKAQFPEDALVSGWTVSILGTRRRQFRTDESKITVCNAVYLEFKIRKAARDFECLIEKKMFPLPNRAQGRSANILI
jgi:hypothetical protein